MTTSYAYGVVHVIGSPVTVPPFQRVADLVKQSWLRKEEKEEKSGGWQYGASDWVVRVAVRCQRLVSGCLDVWMSGIWVSGLEQQYDASDWSRSGSTVPVTCYAVAVRCQRRVWICGSSTVLAAGIWTGCYISRRRTGWLLYKQKKSWLLHKQEKNWLLHKQEESWVWGNSTVLATKLYSSSTVPATELGVREHGSTWLCGGSTVLATQLGLAGLELVLKLVLKKKLVWKEG